MIKYIGWMTALLLACLLLPVSAWAKKATDGGWPHEVGIPQGVVVIYQPEPEKLEGNRLEARAAVALELKGSEEPVFGAIWFEARLDTDRAERTATITELTVTEIRFPDQDDEKAQKLRALLEKEIPKWDLSISMDRLLTTLEMEEKRSEAALELKTDPPKIIFVSEPAVLVSLDGEPRLQKEEGSNLQRVINTPFTILYLPSKKTYYLYADTDTWYAAKDIHGDWAVTRNVPNEVASRAPKAEDEPDAEERKAEDEEEPGPPPKIIVVTEPTELIVSTGKPEFTPISGTDLLYVSNTDSDVLYHIKEKKYYVLLSGRWYAGTKLDGPWRYVPGEKLPPDFARIPEDSEMGTVLYAVPGTDVAKEAVLDAQIPQTATVERKKATLNVEYDGEPKFEDIKGTKMAYAVNTATPVIRFKKKYYACDEAVWFVAGSSRGPWQVATSIPEEIYTIPPECPIYHVTFVRIYKATPEVVYVGYTPGYTNTYVYHTTIVYGTGYWYPYWYGRYYYPRPATWGFHVRWNPWTGWRFGLSYCNGPFRFTIGGGGWYRGGWWGPGRYRGYRHGYRHGYRRGRHAGYRAGYRSGRRNAAQQNMYRNKRNQARTTAPSTSAVKRSKTGTAKKRDNNVFADRNGDVHRKTDHGWQTRTKDGWKSQKGQSTQQQRKQQQGTQKQRTQTKQTQQFKSGAKGRANTQEIERSNKARKRGYQRSRSYNKARGSTSPKGRSHGGGRSSGGGRRR